MRSRHESDYQVSILEIASSSMRESEVIGLKAAWKDKLRTGKFGLNRN